MRKIKAKKQKHQAEVKRILTKKEKIIIAVSGIVLLVLFLSIMFAESTRGRVTVKNNMKNLNVKSLTAYFEDTEGEREGKQYSFENLAHGKKERQKLTPSNLLGREANLRIYFQIEGYEEELFVDAGYFNDNFRGNISIEFKEVEDGLARMYVKAKNSLLPSVLIDCDEVYDIYYKEGYVD